MLKSKIAMAMAAAMVMATLYGCSSSDSGLKNDLKTAQGDVTALQGTIDAIAGALDLPPGSDEAAIMAALMAAPEDQLAAIRTALGDRVAADANATAIAAAITMLAATGPAPVEDEKAAKVVGPAILASEMMDGERTMDNPRIAVDGDSVTDLGDDGNADTKLEMSSMGEVGGFGGGVYSQVDDKDDPKVVDSVYVYTDKEASTDEAYNDYFESTAVSENTNGAGLGLSSSTEGEDDATLVVLIIDNDEVSDNSKLFMSAHLPSTPGTFMEYMDDDMTDDDEREIAGMFRGVMGTYACSTDDCRAERDAKGNLTLEGTWTFTADEPEEDGKIEVVGVISDPDYLTFGFWLREDTSGDDPVAMIETLYGTKQVYSAGTADGLTGDNAGKATYSGAATGKFIRKEFNSSGVGTVVAGGAFTADANLTAYFGIPTSVAADNHNMVSGDITKFMSGGDYIDDTWSVELEATSFQGGNDMDPFTGTTVGDKGADAGAWEGFFAGPPMKAAPTEEDPTNMDDVRPSGIVGEFNGHFTNGHVVGAFGATEDE